MSVSVAFPVYSGLSISQTKFEIHYENTPIFKDIENFTTKHEHFQIKNSDICHISAQNIDCGYSLEPL